MSKIQSDPSVEAERHQTQSATRRQALAALGGLGGLTLASSRLATAQRTRSGDGPDVDPDTEFSVAVFPDTQYYAQQDNGIFEQMGQWVADNREEYNIEAFLHEGDIVQSYGSNNDDEWDVAQNAIGKIDEANIPTVLSLGNHDADNIRDPQTYRSRFPASRYERAERNNSTVLDSGTFEGHAENAFFLQEIHGERFLFLTLEFAPRDAALEWAGRVLRTHSEATAFLVTHTYTYHDGTRTDASDNFAPNWYEGTGLPSGANYNNGEQMWQTELRSHENLASVHSGHHITGPYVARETAHTAGNRTSQAFMNYQTIDNGGDGWFRLLTVNTETYNVRVNTYSPYLGEWSDDAGESFAFNLNALREGQ